MSVGTKDNFRAIVFNLPNQLTYARLLLSIGLFVLIATRYFFPAMLVFIVTASTDWLDGYFARRYDQVTTLGRILDPFADKVVICGTFIFLCAEPNSGVAPWMTVVVVGRELLVTALRSFLEQQGSDFSAAWAGKLKMGLQCVAAGVSLYYLSVGTSVEWVEWVLVLSVWSAVSLKKVSGAVYVRTAWHLIRAAA